jgi:hypothetical protein
MRVCIKVCKFSSVHFSFLERAAQEKRRMNAQYIHICVYVCMYVCTCSMHDIHTLCVYIVHYYVFFICRAFVVVDNRLRAFNQCTAEIRRCPCSFSQEA